MKNTKELLEIYFNRRGLKDNLSTCKHAPEEEHNDVLQSIAAIF